MNKESKKQYSRITCYFRQKLEEKVFHLVKEKCQVFDEELEARGLCLYHVVLQNLTFNCAYSDDELQHIISTCTDVLEAMKQRVNQGMTGDKLKEIKREIEEKNKDTDPVLKKDWDRIGYARAISTDEFEKLISLLGIYTRVGGAYARFISYPSMRDVNAAVFESCIDSFDDDNVYYTALYFLTRGAMHMNCNDPLTEVAAVA